jgi:hypothetical protein
MGMVMNKKLLFGTLCALIFAQSMQAIKLTVVNKKYRGMVEMSVGVKWRSNMRTQYMNKKIRFRKIKHIDLGASNIIMSLGIDYLKGHDWVLFQEDLLKHDIPAWGKYDITIYIEDSSGLLGVVVDGGEKIFINAEPVGFMVEDV